MKKVCSKFLSIFLSATLCLFTLPVANAAHAAEANDNSSIFSQVGIDKAKNLIAQRGAKQDDVVVAVLDDCVDASNPIFAKGQIITDSKYCKNFVEQGSGANPNYEYAYDPSKLVATLGESYVTHGTQVASVIAGSSGIGAGGTNIKILPIRTIKNTSGDGGGSKHRDAFEYLKNLKENDSYMRDKLKCIVMTFSELHNITEQDFGKGENPLECNFYPSDQKDRDLIKSLENLGVLTFVAERNQPQGTAITDFTRPAAYPETISVAGAIKDSSKSDTFMDCVRGSAKEYTTTTGEIGSCFSGWTSISSPMLDFKVAYSLAGGSQGTTTQSGTSLSTGMMASLAAQMFALNSKLSATDVRKILVNKNNAYNHIYSLDPGLQCFGVQGRNGSIGVPNAYKCILEALGETPSANVSAKTTKSSNTSVSIKGVDSSKVSSIEKGKAATVTWKPKNPSVSTNINLLKSVTIKSGSKVIYSTNTSKLNKNVWQVANSEYKRRMKESTKMATFDKISASSKAGGSFVIPANQTTSNITIDVQYQEVTPVYRLYNIISSEHLFTTDKAEYDSWVAKGKNNEDFWIGEGVDWLAPMSGTSVYRLYNPQLGAMGHTSHYYTSDAAEIAKLTSKYGWKKETQFKGGFVFKSGGDSAIYTCYNEALKSAHHYTSSKTEYDGLAKHGWDLEKSKNYNSKTKKWTGFFKCVVGAK